jgi:hypothetical protein
MISSYFLRSGEAGEIVEKRAQQFRDGRLSRIHGIEPTHGQDETLI